MPDRGDRHQPRIILADKGLGPVIDELVSAIWEHTEHWGLAIAGGYWKPILNAEVAPGGESRFGEFERLMDGSGIPVRRKEW